MKYLKSKKEDNTIRIVDDDQGNTLGILGTERDLLKSKVITLAEGQSAAPDSWLFVPADSGEKAVLRRFVDRGSLKEFLENAFKEV